MTATAAAADYATSMRRLGCAIREYGRNGRDGGGAYCATHNESTVYEGEAHRVCRKAYNAANGTCGHVVCQRNGDTCLMER